MSMQLSKLVQRCSEVLLKSKRPISQSSSLRSSSECGNTSSISMSVFPPGPKSQALLKRLDSSVSRTNYVGLYGISLEAGSGPYIADVDGNVYLDCLSAASANVLGYGREHIAKRLYEVISSMQNSGFIYSPNRHAIELAEKLIHITPGRGPKHVLLGLSASDSNGGAIKAMRRYTGKDGIIHFKNAYHGSTGLSQQASGFKLHKEGIYPKNPFFAPVDFPTTPHEAKATLKKIEHYLKTGLYGGVIAEVIQGDAGIFLPPEGFFPNLKSLLEKHDAVLIADEVQSGMGRTGKWWASEHEGISSDIMVMGKGLGGGFIPISAAVGRKKVLESLEPGQQVFTFTGHPGASLAASLVIDTIEKENLIENASQVGALLKKHLEKLWSRYPDIILAVRGMGLMIGVEINISSNAKNAVIFATRCVEKGVYVGYFGAKQEVVRIEPPFVFGEIEVAEIVRIMGEVCEEMKNGTIPKETIENVDKYSIGL